MIVLILRVRKEWRNGQFFGRTAWERVTDWKKRLGKSKPPEL